MFIFRQIDADQERIKYSQIKKTPENSWNLVHILSFDKSMQITIQFDDFFDDPLKDPKFSNSLRPKVSTLLRPEKFVKSIWRAFLQQKSHEIFYLNFVNFSKFKVGLPYKEEIPNTLDTRTLHSVLREIKMFKKSYIKGINVKIRLESNLSWNIALYYEF